MGKRFVLAILAAVAVIGACVGEDPSVTPPTSGGGLGQACVSDVCLEGLVCVDGICRVPSGSSGDAAVTHMDASTSSPDADASSVDEASADTGANQDANADANTDLDANADATDTGTDSGPPPECTDVNATVGPEGICSTMTATALGTGADWTDIAGACDVGGLMATAMVGPGSDSSTILSLDTFGQTIPSNSVVYSVTVKVALNATNEFQLTLGAYVVSNGSLSQDFRTVAAGDGLIVQDYKLSGATAADVNSGHIAVHFKAEKSGNLFSTVKVDSVKMSVHYCPP